MRNVTNAPIPLQAGTFIGQILPYPAIIRVMEDEKPCYGVSSVSPFPHSPHSPHNVSTSSSHDFVESHWWY